MFDLSRIAESVQYEQRISRRLLLAYSSALAGLPLIAKQASALERQVSFSSNPFTLGVASGDPDATSVVIWTKLAPQPLEPSGGMKPEAVIVGWEVAEDESMGKIIASGKAVATPQLGHTVHIEVGGLKPDHWYWYRFHAGDAVSPTGRTRTVPEVDATPEKLKFAFASCQHYETGHYTAYGQMAQDDLDLVFHLGDYIYESPGSDGRVRKHSGSPSSRLTSLSDYRLRHMQYRSDPLLSGMHAKCPWFVTWDDHEFENNYANDIQQEQKSGSQLSPHEYLVQRAAAYQAYYEMMPLRKRSLPQGPDMQLYRTASFGRLAEFFVLDTRQYRTDQPNGDGGKPLNEEALKHTNSLLGKKQRRWLDSELISSISTWNVLAQQVMMELVAFGPKDEQKYSMDQWAGAAYERIELMRFIVDRQIPNPVVLTGDIHSNWANDLRIDDRQHDTPIVATEFVGTSISSGGKGDKKPAGIDLLLSNNPGVKFHNRERGYVRCTITPDRWQSDYVVAEDVTVANSPVVTRASFVTEAGIPGVKPI